MTSFTPQPDPQPETNLQAPPSDPGQPESGAPQPDAAQHPDTPGPQPDPQAQIAAARLEAHRARVSAETGIPEDMLTGATTPEQVDEIAGSALGWLMQAEPPAPPPPKTGAVPVDWANSVGVLGAGDRIDPRHRGPQTADALKAMTPQEIMEAARAGHLVNLGIGVPKSSGTSPMLRRR
jgi:hypothetical protein